MESNVLKTLKIGTLGEFGILNWLRVASFTKNNQVAAKFCKIVLFAANGKF